LRVSIPSKGQGGHVDGLNRWDDKVSAGVKVIPLAMHSAIKSSAIALLDLGGDVETGVGGGAVMVTGDSRTKGL